MSNFINSFSVLFFGLSITALFFRKHIFDNISDQSKFSILKWLLEDPPLWWANFQIINESHYYHLCFQLNILSDLKKIFLFILKSEINIELYYFLLNLLGWHWFIKLYLFQVYNSIIYQLYIDLNKNLGRGRRGYREDKWWWEETDLGGRTVFIYISI